MTLRPRHLSFEMGILELTKLGSEGSIMKRANQIDKEKQVGNKARIIVNVVADGSKATLVLKSNNITMREGCPLCGNGHKDADIPYWIFLAPGRGDNVADYCAVCHRCAEKYVPFLLKVVGALNTMEWYGDEIHAIKKEHLGPF